MRGTPNPIERGQSTRHASARIKRLGFAAAVGFLALSGATAAQTSDDPLAQGFENPPDSAGPRVGWHWMNGNVTKEGIKADLEWMKRLRVAKWE